MLMVTGIAYGQNNMKKDHAHVEDGASNEWLEPVTDEVYGKMTRSSE